MGKLGRYYRSTKVLLDNRTGDIDTDTVIAASLGELPTMHDDYEHLREDADATLQQEIVEGWKARRDPDSPRTYNERATEYADRRIAEVFGKPIKKGAHV